MKHPNNMSKKELRELVSAMGWDALNLAQHLTSANNWLKEEYKEKAYRQAAKMAYEIVLLSIGDSEPRDNTI